MTLVPRHRTVLKWVHWLSLALITYFFLIEPEENRADPGAALSTHAGIGLALAVITLLWFALFLSKGLAGRAGPKLPGWARRFHPLSHKALQYGVLTMVASGGLAALAAPFAIQAFGTLPIGPGFGAKWLHGLVTGLHEILFNLVIAAIVLHAAFHLWRHYLLRDNALRIMVPKALHKYL